MLPIAGKNSFGGAASKRKKNKNKMKLKILKLLSGGRCHGEK